MDKRLIIVCVILLAASSIASCDDVTWTGEKTHTIDWDAPTFSVGSFTVKLTDFDGEGSVALEIIRSGEETAETIDNVLLTTGEVWDNDLIRLECEDATDKNDLESIGRWPWYPEAKIISWVVERKKPDLSIGISTDETRYLYGDEITAKITIDNDGEADIYGVLSKISLSGLDLTDGELVHRIDTIKSGDSRSITMKLRFLMPLYGSVRAEVTGRDKEGVEYHAYASRTVGLKPPLTMRKSATSDIYWGRTVDVSIVVRNIQNYNIRSVTLSDEVPDQFRIEDNFSLNWTFDICPGGEMNYRYRLIPERPGSFTLPAASASWHIWGERDDVYSNYPAVVVHGAFMDVAKTLDPEHVDAGDTVNVTIEIRNTGDLPASIRLVDYIPANASYISGTTNLTTFMRPLETEYLSYSMRMESADVTIPEPVVEFEEMVYDKRIVNYTGNYEVTMSIMAVAEPPSDSAEIVQTINISETVEPEPEPESMEDDQVKDKTLRKQINEKAREVQQNMESLKEMAMPGFGGAWLMIMIMIVYVMRRIF